MHGQDKIDDLFARLKPVIGEKEANSLWLFYHLDSRNKAFIESVSNLLKAKYLDETFERKDIYLPPIPEELAKGGYPLAIVYYGEKPLYRFSLREEEWIHHMAIFGRSGSGKTTVGYTILWNLLVHKKPFLIFDWKRNYRDLLAIKDDILIFTIGRTDSPFFWNPLIPPVGISPKSWIRKIIEILCHAYFLGEGVTYILMNALDQAFSDSGIYEGSEDYPSFRDVFKRVLNYRARGREAQWLDSAKRTMAVLCFGEFGETLNSEQSTPISALLGENVIMELDALTKSDKTFFIEALLLWIHQYRLMQKDREVFKHAILIEEAHHVLLRKKQELSGEEAITDLILREIRELGESIILIDQHPSLISKPALGNTYTTICMNLKDGSDISIIAESISLSFGEREYLGSLPTGSAIVRLSGRWFKPTLVKFPKFPMEKGIVDDSAIKRRMEGYYGKTAPYSPEEKKSEVIRVFRADEKRDMITMNQGETALINDIAAYPLSGIVERYDRIGCNRYQGNRLKNGLLDKELIQENDIKNSRGRIKILVLTEKGHRFAGTDENANLRADGNPGFDHEYWKRKIADFYMRSGYMVEMEKHIGAYGFVDIALEKDGGKTAVEIETGKSRAIYNIRKDLLSGFDRVISIALNNEIQKKISESLKADGIKSEQVIVKNINEFC